MRDQEEQSLKEAKRKQKNIAEQATQLAKEQIRRDAYFAK